MKILNQYLMDKLLTEDERTKIQSHLSLQGFEIPEKVFQSRDLEAINWVCQKRNISQITQ